MPRGALAVGALLHTQPRRSFLHRGMFGGHTFSLDLGRDLSPPNPRWRPTLEEGAARALVDMLR